MRACQLKALLFTILLIKVSYGHAILNDPIEHVTIAILPENQTHFLPFYLTCLEKQTWPKEQTSLYIHTSNDKNTAQILRQWVKNCAKDYADVYFDERFSEDTVPFKVRARVRQNSVNFAKQQGSHYFVADCNMFIQPQTLERLVKTRLPIVAPLLTTAAPSLYANYHADTDANGYYKDTAFYIPVLQREIKGLLQMPVVNGCYFIDATALADIAYEDGSARHEYVIFSENARNKNIPQYLDNRENYGRISFADNKAKFDKEPWIYEFESRDNQLEKAFTQVYEQGIWARNNQGKGSSGEGSTARNTTSYRRFLQDFLKDHAIHSVVDAGCGDWEFSHLIDWKEINYTGYDVVASVIAADREKYGTPTIQFIHADFSKTDLPSADLFICKDVFQHLSNEKILSILPQLSKFKYCLLVNDVRLNGQPENNQDIDMIGYRCLDLSCAPFNVQGEKISTFDCGLVKKEIFLITNLLK